MARRQALTARHPAVGVLVPNTADIEAVFPEIADRPLIVLQFPTFSDGRALSQAVVLRKRLRVKGQMRAVGDVIRDLVFWLGRCGFDSIVPRKDQKLEDCRAALTEFTVASVSDMVPLPGSALLTVQGAPPPGSVSVFGELPL